ncbi:MAG: glucoamylase family protein [candidate division WOR-3 bacterium]|nr:glucoamylase family protein [candidate division WOR-3 bacterium]
MLRRVFIFSILIYPIVLAGTQPDIVIFTEDDYADWGYYDASWGICQDGSYLLLAGPGNDKLPIDSIHSYVGRHSGIIEWLSAPGGHWRIFIASPGWTPHNADGYSNLLLFINGPLELNGALLPKIGLEDLDNQSSPLANMSDYLNGIDGDTLTWQRVIIPLTAFKPYGDFDLNKLKTIRFNQGMDDDSLHTIWVDEIRVVWGEVDTIPPDAPAGLVADHGNECVYLDWDDNTEEDLMGYIVYRSSLQGGTYHRVNASIAMESRYIDRGLVNGNTYYYVVRAIDTRGNESENSNEVWTIPEVDTTAPSPPTGMWVEELDSRLIIGWDDNQEWDILGYNLYREETPGGGYSIINTSLLSTPYYVDDSVSNGNTYWYFATAIDESEHESESSDTLKAIPIALNQDEFLEMVARKAFLYFWNCADPNTGVVQERMTGTVTGATGATGFGLTSICVACERGWIEREEGAQRVLKILRFYNDVVPNFHGLYSHWINMETGEVSPFSPRDDGADVVETSYLIAGALTCRQYFDGGDSIETAIRELATQLYENAEWDWMLQNETGDTLRTMSWHWSPNYGFSGIGMRLTGYNEAMIAYILAIGSPTHPIPPECYELGWASTYQGPATYYGITLDVVSASASLFTYQYTHCWVDFRDRVDLHTDYFNNSVNATLINREYCIDNPNSFDGYGENLWGLTACDGPPPYFYQARGPFQFDDGTIAPTAAAGSTPFTPDYSYQTLRYMYDNYRSDFFGTYGFKDAFNISIEPDWFDNDYIGIDQGPIVIMIENYLSGLVWDRFMQNNEITKAMDMAGFTGVEESPTTIVTSLKCYPNPFQNKTTVSFGLPKDGHITVSVYDVCGRLVKTLTNGMMERGVQTAEWDGKDRNGRKVGKGIYFCRVESGEEDETVKLVLIR